MEKSIKRSLESKAANFKLHALVMGDSTDAADWLNFSLLLEVLMMNVMSLKKWVLQCY